MTNLTCSSTFTSLSGSPSTAMMSAAKPASTAPRRFGWSSRVAAFTVAERIASIGVMPASTM